LAEAKGRKVFYFFQYPRGKLARLLHKQGRSPLLVAADVYRPAAMDQLETLGRQLNLPVYLHRGETDVLKIAREEHHEVAGRMVGPVDAAIAAAEAAGSGNLAVRVPMPTNRGAPAPLAAAVNRLIELFERREADRRRLVDDAAHEIRNPLAVMQTSLDVALAEPADPEGLLAAGSTHWVRPSRLRAVGRGDESRQIGPLVEVAERLTTPVVPPHQERRAADVIAEHELGDRVAEW
jgi:signal transduction histidine kinase